MEEQKANTETSTLGSNKFYKYLRVWGAVGAAIAALVVVWNFFGNVYAIPNTVKQQSTILNTHAAKIEDLGKVTSELKDANTIDRHSIESLKKSIEDVASKQNIMNNQSTEINKNLIELNTSLKFFGESIKELKQEVKEIKDKK